MKFHYNRHNLWNNDMTNITDKIIPSGYWNNKYISLKNIYWPFVCYSLVNLSQDDFLICAPFALNYFCKSERTYLHNDIHIPYK